MEQTFDQDLFPGTTAMMAILLIICIGYVVVASMLIHGARKVTSEKILLINFHFSFRASLVL